MGADLLNRFFGSWMGDAQGKSPLEAARNVIVTYLTGPGLKVFFFFSFVCAGAVLIVWNAGRWCGREEEEDGSGSNVVM